MVREKSNVKVNIPFKPKIKPKAPRSIRPLEKHQQMALVKWARNFGLLLISIPNAGKRSYFLGQQERAMGLTAGVSDLFLCMPNGKHHGYWIELKSKGKKPTELQLDWIDKVRSQGYKAEWFDDWVKAKESIEYYLKGVYDGT
jgi:hypothetical protein